MNKKNEKEFTFENVNELFRGRLMFINASETRVF